LTVNLKQVTLSQYADPDDKASFEVVQFPSKGARATGSEFTPECGSLVLFPVEETSYTKNEANYEKWPAELFGLDIESYRNLSEKEMLTGPRLHFAWNVVNRSHLLVESNGQLYYLALIFETCNLK